MAQTNVNWQVVNAELDQVLGSMSSLNVNAEICGNWIWISGDTRRYSQQLRKLGCEFSKEKTMWFYVPRSLPKLEKNQDRTFTMAEIRGFHGSKHVKSAQQRSRSRSSSRSSSKSSSPIYTRVSAWEVFSLKDILSRLFFLFTAVYR